MTIKEIKLRERNNEKIKKQRTKEKKEKLRLIKKEKRDKKKQKKQMLEDWKHLVHERDNYKDAISGEDLRNTPRNCQAHHILDKKNFPTLKHDVMNGITLSYWNHKSSPKSPHLNALWFTNWLKENRPGQYYYLMNNLKEINKK